MYICHLHASHAYRTSSLVTITTHHDECGIEASVGHVLTRNNMSVDTCPTGWTAHAYVAYSTRWPYLCQVERHARASSSYVRRLANCDDFDMILALQFCCSYCLLHGIIAALSLGCHSTKSSLFFSLLFLSILAGFEGPSSVFMFHVLAHAKSSKLAINFQRMFGVSM